jgi:hypothetical protein
MVKVSAIPDSGSNDKNVSGLRLFWILQRAEGHVHDSRMYGIGISAVPFTICPKRSFKKTLTFTRSISGIKLKEEHPKATVSYGDVPISFP